MTSFGLNMTGVIILAAGASTRLGKAKQTLKYKNKSLLKNAIDAANGAGLYPVIVVIGANETEMRNHLEKEIVNVVCNENWKDGIASSIHSGLNYLEKYMKPLENIVLMVCDQPFVDEKLLRSLLETKQSSNKTIVACSYKDTVGVPALFDNIHFPELLALIGNEGAKKVLLKHPDSLAVIPFPAGAIDIDTVADYEALEK